MTVFLYLPVLSVNYSYYNILIALFSIPSKTSSRRDPTINRHAPPYLDTDDLSVEIKLNLKLITVNSR